MTTPEHERELAEVLARDPRFRGPNLHWDIHTTRVIADAIQSSDWLAARVAEAGARALREAADAWPRDIYRLPESTTVDDWLRDRARGLGGAS